MISSIANQLLLQLQSAEQLTWNAERTLERFPQPECAARRIECLTQGGEASPPQLRLLRARRGALAHTHAHLTASIDELEAHVAYAAILLANRYRKVRRNAAEAEEVRPRPPGQQIHRLVRREEAEEKTV